jgi:hypothetical protein
MMSHDDSSEWRGYGYGSSAHFVAVDSTDPVIVRLQQLGFCFATLLPPVVRFDPVMMPSPSNEYYNIIFIVYKEFYFFVIK